MTKYDKNQIKNCILFIVFIVATAWVVDKYEIMDLVTEFILEQGDYNE